MSWTTRQRDDLKTCPFCGTKAIEQGRMAESDTATQWRIQCGNPFCEALCQTKVFASISAAERVWQERDEVSGKNMDGYPASELIEEGPRRPAAPKRSAWKDYMQSEAGRAEYDTQEAVPADTEEPRS